MNLLVTAGGTTVPIDKVRSIGNLATGRTGALIARAARCRGHGVTLLTSQPDAVGEADLQDSRWNVRPYRTFDELHAALAKALQTPGFDAVVHSAAVSDYRLGGAFVPAPGTKFHDDTATWTASGPPALVDCSAGKVKSNEPELWLRLVRAPKLIDLMRSEWKFRGVIVKFKLEVDVGESELLEIAERSRLHSDADLMVANTVEGATICAYVGPVAGEYAWVDRPELPDRLVDLIEQRLRERHDG